MLFSMRCLRYGSFVAVIGMSFLVGCGGSNSDPAPVVSASPGTGSPDTGTSTSRAAVRVRVTFPKAVNTEKYAQVVSIALENGKRYASYGSMTRSDGGGTVERVFNDVPVGDISVTTTAYAPEPTGYHGDVSVSETVGGGARVITNRAGIGATVDVTLDSAYDHVAISSLDSDGEVGESVSLLAAAKNAAGEDVLTAPQKWQWTFSSPAYGTLDTRDETVIFHPLSTGIAEIRATETGTGKTATFTIPIVKQSPALMVRDASGVNWLNSRKSKIATTIGYPIKTASNGSSGRLALSRDGKIIVNGENQIKWVNPAILADDYASQPVIIPGGPIQSFLGLADGRVLVYTPQGFAIANLQTGNVDSSAQLANFGSVQDMTLGPDGKIYLIAIARDGANIIVRMSLEGDNSITQEAVLRTESNVLFSSLRFLSDGKLAVLEQNTNTIRLYSVSDSSAEPMATPVQIGNPAKRFTVGRGIFTEGDEILYVSTTIGIKRFSYSNGAFTLLEPLFFSNGFNHTEGVSNTIWEDVLIVPRN